MKIKSLLPAILAFAVCGITGCNKNVTPSAQSSEPVTAAQNSSSDENASAYLDFSDDISVTSISIEGKIVEATPEMNEKICSLMKEAQTEKEELELAFLSYIEVSFSNGGCLTIDDNNNNLGSYYLKDSPQSGILSLPGELKGYLLSIAEDVESGKIATK